MRRIKINKNRGKLSKPCSIKLERKGRKKVNRKQRRLMYKKYPALRSVIKKQSGEAA